jgi:hypothetical protein
LEAATKLLKDPLTSAEGSPRLVVAVAESATLIAKSLLELLTALENLIVDLEKDPHYRNVNWASILAGVAGSVVIVLGVLAAFTPAFSTAPVIVANGGAIMAAGGAAALAGGVVCYQGFSKTIVDSDVKKALEEYLKYKLDEMEKFKHPVIAYKDQANALQLLVEREFPGGVSEETIATYVDAFHRLQTAYMNSEPKPSLLAKLKRYLRNRTPVFSAAATAATSTLLVTALATALAPELRTEDGSCTSASTTSTSQQRPPQETQYPDFSTSMMF